MSASLNKVKRISINISIQDINILAISKHDRISLISHAFDSMLFSRHLFLAILIIFSGIEINSASQWPHKAQGHRKDVQPFLYQGAWVSKSYDDNV